MANAQQARSTSKHSDLQSALTAAGYTLQPATVAGEVPGTGATTVTVALVATKSATLTGSLRKALEALGCTGITAQTTLTCSLPLIVATEADAGDGRKRKLTATERHALVREALRG